VEAMASHRAAEQHDARPVPRPGLQVYYLQVLYMSFQESHHH
jgi:hypothetical protein